jgi:hypothetical protein
MDSRGGKFFSSTPFTDQDDWSGCTGDARKLLLKKEETLAHTNRFGELR